MPSGEGPDIVEVDLREVPNIASDARRSLYAYFDDLREKHPLVRCRSAEGSWITFLRAETAKRILMDTETFRTYHPDKRESGYFDDEFLPASKDPPEHRYYRAPIQSVFSARVARTLEPRMREFADELVDRLVMQGACDFIEAFAGPYPGLVFMELMKFPLADLPIITKWDAQFWTAPDDDPDGSLRQSGLQGLRDYVRAQLRAKRASADDSMLSTLVTTEIHGLPLTDEEIVSYGTLACIGGIHTTKAALGRMFLHLATDPKQRSRLHDEPALAGRFVNEALRVYAIGESFRFAARDVVVDGCALRRGDRISVHWPAINRDPREFPAPNTVHLDGPVPSSLAFGYGPHFCVGMHVARHDMQIALEQWLRRIPDFELAADQPIKERVWGGAGLARLPLRWRVVGGNT